MKKYKVKVNLERVVEAENEEEADIKFWEDLEFDNAMENTTTGNRLEENIEIREVEK